MKHIYFLLFTLFSLTINAQLATGDIAFTGYQSDTPDSFSFVVLVDIPASTSIEFTDNGWLATGGFRANEGVATWTSPATITNAGTEIIVSDANGTVNIGTITSSMALSGSGDQLFAYDPNNVPSVGNESGFYAGIQMNGDWDLDATSSNTSAQPTALIGYSLAIDPEVDNAYYNCTTTTGTVAEIRTALIDPSNWIGDNNPITLPSCGFNPTLSIKNDTLHTFSIYPNPTSTGFVNITSKTNDTIQVAVFDILGKQVLNNTVNNNRLDVSTLTTGVYIMNISQNGQTITKKLVVR
ncbi:T9SS type A sorting domain-containing protein [Xanthomarina sp. F2636L]|uniref:T9SS type A sorting domain-containing protein n=1 Tax=Xanthomarina sp. F2636L TaxID=2996018 RepID=UPI00225E641C|nr:T9SS type A sorting domain-containing protein [Xanthomarina sp. F2636L]MCX7550996.1 T9SS type A sorting domain-containing protein [Xanthomarina sp. F2636L]